MSAAEWAALRPGDVVQCGRRIEEPIVLRAGGREIARGELVDIEGEVGIRITRVGSAPR
jgi:flagellar motor switch/type III secretory pathway protein FliN